MKQKNALTVMEKLLLTAYDLEKGGRFSFSAEDLVVSAWQKYPSAFGLAGYMDDSGVLCYPDSNRVFAEIMGSKPLRKRGFLIKVGSKMYKLTEAGTEHASLLSKRVGVSQVEKAGLAREIIIKLKKLLSSKAFEKFVCNRYMDITFHDACYFWGISPRSSAVEYEGQVANIFRVIDIAKKAVKDNTVTFEHRGDILSMNEIEKLLELHKEMVDKFKSEIEIIKKRTDERL